MSKCSGYIQLRSVRLILELESFYFFSGKRRNESQVFFRGTGEETFDFGKLYVVQLVLHLEKQK